MAAGVRASAPLAALALAALLSLAALVGVVGAVWAMEGAFARQAAEFFPVLPPQRGACLGQG
eukprot:2531249-Alexandrium_andersonii.AAC.1